MAKRYLDVSYEDRELAKRLGAKWDPSVRRWYCPAGSPLAKIFKWRAEAQANVRQDHNNIETKPQNIRMNSDIHFKSASLMAPIAPKKKPAVHQNFELFMAS